MAIIIIYYDGCMCAHGRRFFGEAVELETTQRYSELQTRKETASRNTVLYKYSAKDAILSRLYDGKDRYDR